MHDAHQSTTEISQSPPPGFEVWDPGHRGFIRLCGPLYLRPGGEYATFGMRVTHDHINIGGVAHGGFLVTLADTALGVTVSKMRDVPHAQVTASLSVDFLGVVKLGDWLEADVHIERMGKRLAFATCYLTANGARVLRSSALFALR